MNVLFVTHHYLSGVGGGVFASKAFANVFSEIADEITLLYPVKDTEDTPGLNAKIQKVPVTYCVPKWKKLMNVCIGKTHRFYDVFDWAMAEKRYDCVVFDNSCTSFGLIDIAKKYHATIITIHHNYEYEYVRDSTVSLLKPIKLYWVKRYEEESLRKSDLNLTLTTQDKKLLAMSYGVSTENIEVLGCFECTHKEYHANCPSHPNTFVITGNLSAKQTEDSLIPWLHTYYPLLMRLVPDARLCIAGKHPSSIMKSLCESYHINLIDTPPDMNVVLDEAQFYICPVSLGGGIKLRIMDGLSHGLPVLSHSVSARGYDGFVGKCLFVYNDENSFCEAVKCMTASAFDKNSIIDIYRNGFSYTQGLKRLRQILSKKHIV